MTYTLDISRRAEDRIADILRYSEIQFGSETRKKYRHLTEAGLAELINDPMRPASQSRDDLRAGYRAYHLRHVQMETSRKINKPRHVIFYRIHGRTLIVLDVLHDSMDYKRHFPNGVE